MPTYAYIYIYIYIYIPTFLYLIYNSVGVKNRLYKSQILN